MIRKKPFVPKKRIIRLTDKLTHNLSIIAFSVIPFFSFHTLSYEEMLLRGRRNYFQSQLYLKLVFYGQSKKSSDRN